MTHHFDYVWKMVSALRNTSSTKDKEDIIKIYCEIFDNPSAVFARKILLYTYHPLWQYNVTSDNLKKKNHLVASNNEYKNFFDLLDALKSRKITGHDAISAVNSFIEHYSEYEELIHCVIDKDLKTRAGDKIINKAIPDHIPEFSVALADKYEPKLVDWEDGWYVSRKIDGCVDYDTIVEFEDGTKMSIGYVVNNQISGSVKSYNHKTKKVEFKPILNHMKNLHDISETRPTQWYKITLENGSILNITGNDTVYLPKLRCYRRVDELNGDEEVFFDN
jgi:intein/homing endonuclease